MKLQEEINAVRDVEQEDDALVSTEEVEEVSEEDAERKKQIIIIIRFLLDFSSEIRL